MSDFPIKEMYQAFGTNGNLKLPKGQITKIPLGPNGNTVGITKDTFEIQEGGLHCKKSGIYLFWGSVYFSSAGSKDVGIYLKKTENYNSDFSKSKEICSVRNGSGIEGAMNIGPFLCSIQDGDTVFLCGRSLGADGMATLGNPNVTYLGAWRLVL